MLIEKLEIYIFKFLETSVQLNFQYHVLHTMIAKL